MQPECVWVGPIKYNRVWERNAKTLENVLPPDCMNACNEETSFDCVSFDYVYDSRLCHLQKVDRSDVVLTFGEHAQYYEKDCNRE